MEENFNVVAQSRANYYTPGSPVQFVRVELMRGDQSGENAVCLTFKNIGPVSITGLDVSFRCKGEGGTLLCEQSFEYREFSAGEGELFGMDDAVFVTPQSITSVDVTLLTAYADGKKRDLSGCKRVRLPAPKRLAKEVAAYLERETGRKGLKYAPQVLENGWFCACGAFHPSEENTAYCSECGSDRILLQTAITSYMQPDSPAEPAAVDEPTREMKPGTSSAPKPAGKGNTRTFEPQSSGTPSWQPAGEMAQKRISSEAAEVFVRNYRDDTAAHEEDDPRDALAENLIRWVPALSALLCAAIVLGGFVYCKIML